jgi:isocitrate/isopropylmalate dehydrogenase
MLEWLGEKYTDPKCIKAAAAIEKGVIYVLENRQGVADLGGKATTVGMAEAIAAAMPSAK